MNAVDRFLISYLDPEISTFKGPKHDTQNWFTANNNNGENYDVIRLINYNSIITESNPLKLEEQKVVTKKCLIFVEFWLSRQHSRFQAPFIQNNNSHLFLLWSKKNDF